MRTLLKNAQIVNEGKIIEADVLIDGERIAKIAKDISDEHVKVIDLNGLLLMPGIIDDQVHFREPGLTHKAEIYTEAKSAVAGGTTTFMEMPNTKPTATNQPELEKKYERAKAVSLSNYSFFMGATNDNLDEVLKTNIQDVCGIKIFMGSSTGNMLVDNEATLEKIFNESPMLIATHCEDEMTIRNNFAKYKEKYGDDIPIEMHPIIRNAEGCYLSSSMAIELAKANDTRLHILHISTKDELDLFRNDIPLAEKKITAEVCVHHLYFNSDRYADLGAQIKCNPAIKDASHQAAIFEALLDNRLDIIATDHAPHTWEEKSNLYTTAPSGVPLVQHSLNVMLEFYHQGKISLERIVEKMCHAPAICFQIKERGYIREGYYADLVVVDPNQNWEVTKENVLYKCNWSPFEGHTFKGQIQKTFVSGHLVYNNGVFDESQKGQRVHFER